jgi:hypothetical protein
MRLKILLAATVLSALPVLSNEAFARDRDDRYYRDDRRVEVFYRDGCRVEREWGRRGRYSETVDCRHDDRRRYAGHGWGDDRRRNYDDGHQRYVGAFFGESHRGALSRHYGGRDCDRWRADWRRPYRVGHAFPREHHYRPISRDIYGYLPPPPRGHFYAHYNDDVLLIREATRLVVDAILASDRGRRW